MLQLDTVVSAVWVLSCAVLSAVLYFHQGRVGKSITIPLSRPPGPKGFPVIGVLPFLRHFPELALHRWAKKYGNLFTFRNGNQLFLVISDPGIAKHFMVTNGAIFSSRKELFVKSLTIFSSRGITATPYGERWRKHRRLVMTWLSPRAVQSYGPVLDDEAARMIRRIYDKANGGTSAVSPPMDAGQFCLNVMIRLTFGLDPYKDNSIFEQSIAIAREFMNCTSPISNYEDFVPWLRSIPTPMIRRSKKLHEDLLQTYGGLINKFKHHIEYEKEDIPDCLVKKLLSVKDIEGLDDLDMTMLASAFLIAGVDAASSIMQWLCVLIPSYPEVQKRAHEELDRVVGRDRLPTSEDEESLPYIRAIIKEVERIRSPFWIPTPHFSTADYVYEGKWIIPKGTVVLLNTYTMQHDPGRHEDPWSFKPERYLGDKLSSAESANLPNPYKRDHWMFGYGRRICPAMALTEAQIFLTISRLLWAFHMAPVDGETLDTTAYDGLNARSPAPFRIKMVPRDEKVAQVLEMKALI